MCCLFDLVLCGLFQTMSGDRGLSKKLCIASACSWSVASWAFRLVNLIDNCSQSFIAFVLFPHSVSCLLIMMKDMKDERCFGFVQREL